MRDSLQLVQDGRLKFNRRKRFVPGKAGVLSLDTFSTGNKVLTQNLTLADKRFVGAVASGNSGGPVTVWTPKQLTGLLWGIRASDESYNDGDLVATATDQSGNGRNFTQSTDASKPTFKKNIVNGKSVYRLNGSNFMAQGAFTIGTTQKVSCFMVVNWSALVPTNGDIIVERGNPFFSTVGSHVAGDFGNSKCSSASDGNVGLTQFVNNTVIVVGTWNKAVARCDFSLATNEATCLFNGSEAGTYNNNSNNTGDFNQSLAFSFGARATGVFPFTGDVAEIWFTNTINASDETLWNSYVLAQYGI